MQKILILGGTGSLGHKLVTTFPKQARFTSTRGLYFSIHSSASVGPFSSFLGAGFLGQTFLGKGVSFL